MGAKNANLANFSGVPRGIARGGGAGRGGGATAGARGGRAEAVWGAAAPCGGREPAHKTAMVEGRKRGPTGMYL